MKHFFTFKNIIVYVIVLALAAIVILQTQTDYRIFPVKSDEVAQQDQGERTELPTLKEDQTCKGDPIYVDYLYPHDRNDSNFENPWECQVQCNENKQRYIFYPDKVGTQCDVLPECLDLGEDLSVTCNPPKKDIPKEEEDKKE